MNVVQMCLTLGQWTFGECRWHWRKIQELVNKIAPTTILVQIAVLLKNPIFQGLWSTSRWPWTFL